MTEIGYDFAGGSEISGFQYFKITAAFSFAAHPVYGSGDELILDDQMDRRLHRLAEFGLQGVEAFYSTFTPKMVREMLCFAEKYNLYVTAGSDYHGKNKWIDLGETNLDMVDSIPDGMKRFMSVIGYAAG